MEFIWQNTDPRLEISDWAEIVIVRPDLLGNWQTGIGHVSAKHTWCVFTTFEDHKLLDSDQDWDESWYWIFSPEVK